MNFNSQPFPTPTSKLTLGILMGGFIRKFRASPGEKGMVKSYITMCFLFSSSFILYIGILKALRSPLKKPFQLGLNCFPNILGIESIIY